MVSDYQGRLFYQHGECSIKRVNVEGTSDRENSIHKT